MIFFKVHNVTPVKLYWGTHFTTSSVKNNNPEKDQEGGD